MKCFGSCFGKSTGYHQNSREISKLKKDAKNKIVAAEKLNKKNERISANALFNQAITKYKEAEGINQPQEDRKKIRFDIGEAYFSLGQNWLRLQNNSEEIKAYEKALEYGVRNTETMTWINEKINKKAKEKETPATQATTFPEIEQIHNDTVADLMKNAKIHRITEAFKQREDAILEQNTMHKETIGSEKKN